MTRVQHAATARRSDLRIGLALAGILLLASITVPGVAWGRDLRPRGLDLEDALARADLVLAARVTKVSESTIVYGGKAAVTTEQFYFEPVRTLKGIYSRKELLLTNTDLGNYRSAEEGEGLRPGQLRLLILGRSGQGFLCQNQTGMLDASLPPLRDADDPLLAAVSLLIRVHREPDRAKRVAMIVPRLGESRSQPAIALLGALQRRALLAAQTDGTVPALTRVLADDATAVREATARDLQAVLEAGAVEDRGARESAAAALARALGHPDTSLTARVAAIEALGAAGEAARSDRAAADWLRLDREVRTEAERAAILRAVSALGAEGPKQAVTTFYQQLPLDSAGELAQAAGSALVRLAGADAREPIRARLDARHALGLDISPEIQLFGELPRDAAVAALTEVARRTLEGGELSALASACTRRPDGRLVPVVERLLDPRWPQVRWLAIEALRTIDTDAAAAALQPHLAEEPDLGRKLQIAELLGRHGIRDGYSYAIEHLSEPGLRDLAVAALAAIRDPGAVPELRAVLQSSNDVAWSDAAIRALGRLGADEFRPQFLDLARDLRDPLAPAALAALADLKEPRALPIVRQALDSRNPATVVAAAEAAAKLLTIPNADTAAIRDQLAALVSDAQAAEFLRSTALETLVKVHDERLPKALSAAVRDAGLEGTALLQRIEQLIRDRKIRVLP